MKKLMFFLMLVVSMIGKNALAEDITFPGGSYRKSCNDCGIEKKENGEVLLHCDCGKGRSTINRFQCENDDVWNKNGQLTCAKDKDLPGGSYTDSCHDCKYLNPDTIYCCCESPSVRGCNKTTLNFSMCDTQGEITNATGSLYCHPSRE